MIKHVYEILAKSEEVGLNVTSARDFVDETKSFPNGDFFKEMFPKSSTKATSTMDEISRTGRQFVRERNITELAIIELMQDIDRLDGEVIKAS